MRNIAIALIAYVSLNGVVLAAIAYQYRTRLREGAQQQANFVGHYIVVIWGCGTKCGSGAVIDAITSHVVFLPVEVSSGLDGDAPDFNPILFNINSRLIKIRGYDRNEEKTATFFMDFDGKVFHEIYHQVSEDQVSEDIVKSVREEPLPVSITEKTLFGFIMQTSTGDRDSEGEGRIIPARTKSLVLVLDNPILNDSQKITFIEISSIKPKWPGYHVKVTGSIEPTGEGNYFNIKPREEIKT